MNNNTNRLNALRDLELRAIAIHANAMLVDIRRCIKAIESDPAARVDFLIEYQDALKPYREKEWRARCQREIVEAMIETLRTADR